MAGRLIEVQRLDVLGNRADKAFAKPQLGEVDRFLFQAARGEQLQYAVAQQIDRANLAVQRLADDLHDLIELGLRGRAGSHHVMKTSQDFACGVCCCRLAHAKVAIRKRCTIPSAIGARTA